MTLRNDILYSNIRMNQRTFCRIANITLNLTSVIKSRHPSASDILVKEYRIDSIKKNAPFKKVQNTPPEIYV